MSQPRVLQVLGPSTGGIRRHVTFVTSVLREAGWHVEIAGPGGVVADLDHVVDITRTANPVAIGRAVRALRPLLGSCDVVHCHGLTAGWATVLAKGLRRAHRGQRPVLVVSVHNLVLDDVRGRSSAVLRRLEGWLPGRAAATIAISGEVARRFDGLPGAERIRVIPPAGPPPQPTRTPPQVRTALGVAPGDDLVVTPARLTPQKGLDVLIDAAEMVVAQRPELRWFVFGEGPMRDRLETEIGRRGLAGVVTLAGSRPTVDDEMAAADVVAITSQWESGPLVLLEALALGRPVVSTRVGLAADVIVDGVGRVTDVGAAEQIADAIVDLLRDPPSSVGAMPRSLARFQPARLASEVEAVYREVTTP